MKEEIAAMRQMQELVLTRDEHHQTGDGSHIDELNDAIDALRTKLSPQASAIYDRLYKKNHVVLAAMSNGCCAACGMQVPIAQGQQVCLGEHLVTCSSCGRILFADGADAARNVSVPGDREDPKTGIARFSSDALMIADMDAKTPQEAVRALAQAMANAQCIANADSLVTAAMEREGVLSTAIGGGLAFPHVRGVEGGGLTLALGVSKKGIDWDGENKVNIVILSAIPVAVSAFYLRLMAGLTQAFGKPANVKAVVDADDSETLWKALCKITRATVK